MSGVHSPRVYTPDPVGPSLVGWIVSEGDPLKYGSREDLELLGSQVS